MALSLNPANKTISVPQSDLTLVSGTLYTMDTEAYFRQSLMALLASEDYIWCEDAYKHNTQVTIVGVTYARFIEVINNFTVEFTPNSQWTVLLEGSNNNIFDVGGLVLVQNQVQVIPNNAAGLVVVAADLTPTDIAAAVWDEDL